MTELYKPTPDDLWFREALLADPQTMSYNAAWDGTIPFPEEDWLPWYREWLESPEDQRFYRYLYDPGLRAFVGEIAWHYDSEREMHICDVIIRAECRNRGFGSAGIRLLCEAAEARGITALYDDIAAGNPSWKLFLKNGFEIVSQDEEIVMVRKTLKAADTAGKMNGIRV